MNHREWGLRHFLIPQIIGVIWLLTVVFVVLGAVSTFIIPWHLGRSMESVTLLEVLKGIGWSLLALFTIRVFLEGISVVFSIHDRLEEILDELRGSRDQFRKLNLGISTSSPLTKTKPQLFS